MLFAIALAICAPLPTQSDLIIDWDRQFGNGTNSLGVPTAVVPVSDGGVIMTGRRVARLDSTGATIWERYLYSAPNSYIVVGAASDGADGAVIMGTRFGTGSCFAFRYDANGALVWTTEIEESTVGTFAGITIHDAVGDGAGGIVGVGNEFIGGVGLSATIVHVDANGNEVARLRPVGTSVTEYFAVDRAPNGDYAISTTDRIVLGGMQVNRTEVALFDSNFDLIWRRDFGVLPLRARNVGFGGAGGIYVGFNRGSSQNASILRLDRTNGSTLFEAPLAETELTSRAFDYAPVDGGGVYVCGRASSGPGTKGLVQRISPTGEPGPARIFGQDTTADNKYVYSRIVRVGDGVLAYGMAEESEFFPMNQGIVAGLLTAFLPEPGDTYCGPAVPNSTGAPAAITAHGDDAATSSGLVLRAQELPPGTTTLFIVGSEQGSTPILGNGQGIICLGGQLGRYSAQIGFARPDGVSEVIVNPAATPTPAGPVAITAGQTWNFQCWYRDNNPAATSNATDAVSVVFD